MTLAIATPPTSSAGRLRRSNTMRSYRDAAASSSPTPWRGEEETDVASPMIVTVTDRRKEEESSPVVGAGTSKRKSSGGSSHPPPPSTPTTPTTGKGCASPPNSPSTSPTSQRARKVQRRTSPPRPRGRRANTRPAARSVHFADPLVTQVWTRPRTASCDIEILFYSPEDEDRMREEYHAETLFVVDAAEELESCVPQTEVMGYGEEAELISEEGEDEARMVSDDEDCGSESSDFDGFSLSTGTRNDNLTSPTARQRAEEKLRPSTKDYAISKAVVVHHGKVQTYYDDIAERLSDDPLGCGNADIVADPAPFDFDNPDFWNGTVTWY